MSFFIANAATLRRVSQSTLGFGTVRDRLEEFGTRRGRVGANAVGKRWQSLKFRQPDA